MSVKIKNLTKLYGSQTAVNNISFEVQKGEVVGFLGPNGAGKTTTMKILTCFIPPTQGIASVCGHEVTADTLQVRRMIGYLPEHNPLYKDMYVKEYLSFVANVYKIKNKKARINEMIERTGLGVEQNKLIGSLSKGYRQRVGLAQAMLHDPEVLILDEPTSGLDPNQLIDIRNLIKELGKSKTVIFSTHIMQEVEALCDRVIIINKGNIVADDTVGMLQKRSTNETVITVEFSAAAALSSIEGIEGVSGVEALGNHRFKIKSSSETDIRPAIFEFAVRHKLVLLEMHREIFSIEDVFQALTKRLEN